MVGADHKTLFPQIPEGEFEMLAGNAQDFLKFLNVNPGVVGLPHPLDVEHGQHGLPLFAFGLHPPGSRFRAENAPLPLLRPPPFDVVGGPAHRVAEHPVGGHQGLEKRFVPRVLVLRVIAFGQNPVDPMDGIRLRFRVNLQELVIVQLLVVGVHGVGVPKRGTSRRTQLKRDAGPKRFSCRIDPTDDPVRTAGPGGHAGRRSLDKYGLSGLQLRGHQNPDAALRKVLHRRR